LHGLLYGAEYGYWIAFETYVAEGLNEFYKSYDPTKTAFGYEKDIMETTAIIQTDKSDVETAPVPKARLWTGGVMSTLSALFLFMDGFLCETSVCKRLDSQQFRF
jgi:hypothetical protein